MRNELFSEDLHVNDLVDTNKGWRGRIVKIEPRANKWPYTVKTMTGWEHDLFAAHELEKVVEEDTKPGEVLDALRTINLEIQAAEQKLKDLRRVRKVLEGAQLRDLREA